jgi:uncharacterized protein (DUF2237 family)
MTDDPYPSDDTEDRAESRNVLGGQLEPCSSDPLTGFFRNGCCDTGREDIGAHVVCAEMTEDFLEFSVAMGNDLVTPSPLAGFPGLNPGDRWCLCALRWKEALAAGVAPPIVLASTHERVLEFVTLAELVEHALDVS